MDISKKFSAVLLLYRQSNPGWRDSSLSEDICASLTALHNLETQNFDSKHPWFPDETIFSVTSHEVVVQISRFFNSFS